MSLTYILNDSSYGNDAEILNTRSWILRRDSEFDAFGRHKLTTKFTELLVGAGIRLSE